MRKKIHEPYNKLKGGLREKDLTYLDIAKTLDISETSVNFKINGASDFYIGEVRKLIEKYEFPLEYFLTDSKCIKSSERR